MTPARLTVVGGGLAGVEAAWAAARLGLEVTLIEMRPGRTTPAHTTGALAELVCSNSFKSERPTSAHALLKDELRGAGSIVLEAAEEARVPAGEALAVDRARFARAVSARIEAAPAIRRVEGEATEIPDPPAVVASGPLTSPALAEALGRRTGAASLAFYDAIAPVVTGESVDPGEAFLASRWGRGGDDYWNCPLDEATYHAFVEALVRGEKVPLHAFEEIPYFEGCLPIEVMAERGPETLAFGPMKPVGLADPKTGRRPYAVAQLRREDRAGTLWNLVGFQTKLTYPEQVRIFRTLPALRGAEFVRLGSIHRNTFVNAPRVLSETLELRGSPGIHLAGQLTGVEGYVESAALGLLAGIHAVRRIRGAEPAPPPRETMLGGLMGHLTGSNPRTFQPTNAHWGLLPPASTAGPAGEGDRRTLLRAAQRKRALRAAAAWRERVGLAPEGSLESKTGTGPDGAV